MNYKTSHRRIPNKDEKFILKYLKKNRTGKIMLMYFF